VIWIIVVLALLLAVGAAWAPVRAYAKWLALFLAILAVWFAYNDFRGGGD
jgi:hypothetical protein